MQMIPRKRTRKKEKKDKTRLFLFVNLFTKQTFWKNRNIEIVTALHSEKY